MAHLTLRRYALISVAAAVVTLGLKGAAYLLTGSVGILSDALESVVNLLAAAVIVLSSEAIAMGVKAGLNARQMCDIINAGSGRNSATQDKFPRTVLPRTFDFGFATELLYKDVKLCLDEAEALGVPMLVGNAVRQLLAATKAVQGPNSDITTMVK